MTFRTPDISTAHPQPAAGVAAPRCPACGSTSTVSKDKTPDANSYWRCHRCQEVWSPHRQIARGGWTR